MKNFKKSKIQIYKYKYKYSPFFGYPLIRH